MLRTIFCFLGLTFAVAFFTVALAQKPANNPLPPFAGDWQFKKLSTKGLDTIRLDSCPIITATLEIFPAQPYQLVDNKLLLTKPLGDSVQVRYRRLNTPLYTPQSRKDRALIGAQPNTQNSLIGAGYVYNPYKTPSREQLDSKGLDYSGSFARGISVGNKQDLVLNSNFNLQLAGKLGDVELIGAISDNNIPLQPEGNTQQLQDFDRVFVQFKLPAHQLTAGDYNLSNPQAAYFGRYNRRLQGGQLRDSLRFGKSKNLLLELSNSFALARGKFARNIFMGIEGNQGPYKLTGNNGEKFIILIAGTERVFIDGELLARGADRDYVIDYNLCEVRFTNRKLITKDKRIQVEFTYNDVNFTRTMYEHTQTWTYKKVSVYAQYFTEQDAKNQSANQQLNDTTRAILQAVGDSVNLAVVPSPKRVERSGQTANLLLYKLVDTLVNGQLYDSVLVFDPQDTAAVFTVQFSPVQNGAGDYVRAPIATNGATYVWIAPDPLTGKKQGTHAPVVLLIAPKRQQFLGAGVIWSAGKSTQVRADFGMTNNDPNTFSSLDNNNHRGLAFRVLAQHQTDKYALAGFYEQVGKRFQSVEPYRVREFARDWNTTNLPTTREDWAGLRLGFSPQKGINLGFESSVLYKDTAYQGWRNLLTGKIVLKNFRFNTQSSLVLAQTPESRTVFLRPNANISYTFPKLGGLEWGANYEQEQSEYKNTRTDSLLPTSFGFQVFKTYLNLPTWKEKFGFQANVQRRYDSTSKGKSLGLATFADEWALTGFLKTKETSRLDLSFNYRNLHISDTALSKLQPAQTYVGRGEYNLQVLKGFLKWNSIYELGSGQQQKFEYNYIKTDMGTGTHVWIDRNTNGIEEQNEFETANFQDRADYVRVISLSNSFVRTQNLIFNQSVDITPKLLLQRRPEKLKKSKILNLVNRLSARTVWRIDKKSFAGASTQAFNPFSLSVADTTVANLGNSVQNSLYFDRFSPRFGFELSQSDNRSKTLLANGSQAQTRSEYSGNYRLKLWKKITFNQSFGFGQKTSTNQAFSDRDFRVDFLQNEQNLNLIYKTSLRFIGKYAYKRQLNRIGGMERAISNGFSLETTYNKSGGFNLRTQISLIRLKYEGQENTPVQFILTEGLRDGTNYIWTLNFDKTISKNIQFTLSYEGRKTGNTQVVHVGRAQVRAVF
jgi:hypothetical protein